MSETNSPLTRIQVRNPGPAFIAQVLTAFQFEFTHLQGDIYPVIHLDCMHVQPAALGSLQKGYIHSPGRSCRRCYPSDAPLGLEWTQAMVVLEITASDPRLDHFHALYHSFTQSQEVES